MKERFKSILTLLSGEGYKTDMAGRRASPYVIDGYNEIAENRFLLTVDLSPYCYIRTPDAPYANVKKRTDKMILQFYPPSPEDDVFTVEIMHIFGGLQTMGMDLDSFSRQIFTFLNKNIGSFAGTGAYLGIEPPGSMNASLNSMLHFFVGWSDDEITNVLSFQLATMYRALELLLEDYLREASLTILKRFD